MTGYRPAIRPHPGVFGHPGINAGGGAPEGAFNLNFADQVYFADGASFDASAFTFVRSTARMRRNSSGLWESVAAGTLRDGHHDVDGTPLGGLFEENSTKLALWSDDFTQGAWAAVNGTATKDQTGADGVANSASRLTATSANATFLQSITASSAPYWSTAFVRRVTGSDTIEMTTNGGSTWVDITADIDSTYYRFVTPGALTLANPQVGFRITGSGDEIAVQFFGCEANQATSPVTTEGSTVFVNDDLLDWSLSGVDQYDPTQGTIIAMVSPYEGNWAHGDIDPRNIFNISNGTNDNERIYCWLATDTSHRVQFVESGGSLDTLFTTPADQVSPRAYGVAWSMDDYYFTLDGGADTDSGPSTPPGVLPATSAISIGRPRGALTGMFKGVIKSIVYYPERKADADVDALAVYA